MSHIKQRSNKQGPMESSIFIDQKLQLVSRPLDKGLRLKQIKLWFNLQASTSQPKCNHSVCN